MDKADLILAKLAKIEAEQAELRAMLTDPKTGKNWLYLIHDVVTDIDWKMK